LICDSETKKSGALRSTPALSVTFTVTPPSVVGNGTDVAVRVLEARFSPKAATIDSAESSPL
jgi:hypothetical protein